MAKKSHTLDEKMNNCLIEYARLESGELPIICCRENAVVSSDEGSVEEKVGCFEMNALLHPAPPAPPCSAVRSREAFSAYNSKYNSHTNSKYKFKIQFKYKFKIQIQN